MAAKPKSIFDSEHKPTPEQESRWADEARKVWRKRTLDDAEKWMQADEDFRVALLRLAKHYGKGKRGNKKNTVADSMMLLFDFDYARGQLKKNRGPLYNPTNTTKADWLIKNHFKYKGAEVGAVVQRLKRVPAHIKSLFKVQY